MPAPPTAPPAPAVGAGTGLSAPGTPLPGIPGAVSRILPRQPAPGRPTVLVVDDEPDQLALLCAMFRRAGCEVHGASGASSAVDLATDLDFDMFVVDLRMPGISGWALAQTLRHARGGGRVVICSVLDPEDYPPADDILPKPVTRARVQALLARQLAAQGAR